jgi:hypothetical protein
MVNVFVDPASPTQAAGKTDYLFVSGKGTVFEADKATKLSEVTDGLSNTIVVVEVQNSGVSWAEPKDLDINQAMALPAGNHSGGNLAAIGDGSVRFISKSVSPQTIRDMATKAGNEMVTLP